ncbi:VCBS repeat-containing protein [Streptomyces sp. TLI_146]|uniref:FG-GAP repeat domain-containing protein n=1 Tax=Streptomyces sp. TLI_146 TaxID=1938858 RepID=UPI00214C5032|nr:VCBS repeat-containing protein [Streptomyces sp. TLI_146]
MHTAMAADSGASEAGLDLSTPSPIYVNGTPGETDLTVTNPPVGDAYIRLDLHGAGLDHIRITDDAGTEVPSHYDPSDGSRRIFEIGAADSDRDGIPGAPLTEGTTRLHMAAEYGVDSHVSMYGRLVDGASGQFLDNAFEQGPIGMRLSSPSFTSNWESPGHGTGTDATIDVSVGYPQPAHMRLTTRMGAMASPPATTHTRLRFTAQQLAAAHYTASQVADGVRVEYSADGVRYDRVPWTIDGSGAAVLDFPSRSWGPDKPIEQSDHLRVSGSWELPTAGFLKGAFSTLADDGRQVLAQDQEFIFERDYVPAFARHSFYGRDAAGVLWQYKEGAYPDYRGQYYTPRTRVGGGWQAYDTLTKLSTFGVQGNGDLVARDRSGVLWYYRGSGDGDAPFLSRIRVGGGWQVYDTLVGAGDVSGDGRPDLLARDRAGTLWLYKGTGNPSAPFASRTRIGGGWNTYTTIVGGTDLTGDGRPDLVARDRNGVLWLYQGTGRASAPFADRTRVGGGWNTYTALTSPGDLSGHSHGGSLLARDHDGRLWIYFATGKADVPFGPRLEIGDGWNTYNTLI